MGDPIVVLTGEQGDVVGLRKPAEYVVADASIDIGRSDRDLVATAEIALIPNRA